MNQITTLFFATLRDRAGVKSAELQIPTQMTVADFKTMLVGKFPALAGLMNHTLVSINHEYVFDETIIPDRAEIALFPPVSGG
ncbi:MAG: molybdopterin converting factor subunit 1 [Chloroflexi bacterium RIFOXYC12_FULL_59_14]|nr:MAG: molybdopterin converting factor subunit 1 [Chloroflexi bacterium RIFOXYC12_FULL_59_14]